MAIFLVYLNNYRNIYLIKQEFLTLRLGIFPIPILPFLSFPSPTLSSPPRAPATFKPFQQTIIKSQDDQKSLEESQKATPESLEESQEADLEAELYEGGASAGDQVIIG